jgi:uncharacterized protein YxjI
LKELTLLKGNKTEKEYQVFEDEKEVYYVSEVLTLPTRKRYYLYQEGGKKLGEIKRKRYSMGYVDLPRLFLKLNAYNEISILKDMQNFRTSYEIKGEKLALAGTFLGDKFDVTRGNEKIASVQVTKENDNYIFTVQVLKENLEILIVGFVSLLSFVYEHENVNLDPVQ